MGGLCDTVLPLLMLLLWDLVCLCVRICRVGGVYCIYRGLRRDASAPLGQVPNGTRASVPHRSSIVSTIVVYVDARARPGETVADVFLLGAEGSGS